MGLGRYTPTATLRGTLDNRELGSLRPINHPVITSSNDLGNLRSNRDNGFLFELPRHWVQRGRLQLEFTVNHTQAIPETGQNPLANNRASTQQIEVIQMGSPCLVFVPIHTRAPDYSPHDPNSGFAEILFRAESLLPVSGLRFAIKSERISKPVVRINYKRVLGARLIPYPAVELEPFDVSEGFNEPMLWLKLYSAFHKNPAGCEDTHYVGTVHWTADTNGRRGLASRPSTGVAEDSIVKMEPRGSVPDLQPWDDPRGGRTLAHELGHNYTLRHIDQTTSGFDCGGGAPENSESYPYDTCTIGILDAANLSVELASRSTQYGFDPISLSVIKPDDAGDLMSYRSSRWTSKATLDRLFGRIPGFQAPGAFAPAARHSRLGVGALPASVILVNGSLDLEVSSGVLWPAYRLPSSEFDPKKILNSIEAQPSVEGWHIRLLNAAGALLAEYPLDLHLPEDGDRHKAGFVQFIPDHPEAARLQLVNGAILAAETGASLHPPIVVLEKVEVDAGKQQLFFQWAGEDPDGDLLFFTLQFSPDDGESWQTLQANYGQQSYATSTRLLPGGDRARVRVIATDGFHSALAASQPFVLQKRPPEILLSGIKHGDRLPVGQRVVAQAIAYDPEDGNLDPAFLQWSLHGTASFHGTGGTISLQDLPPGLYQLNLSATDSDQQTGAASVQFEIGELVVPESSAPELDGLCGDPAYANAPVVRIPLGGDNYSTVRLIHAGDALYACFSGLNFATGENQFAAAGLRVDRNFSRDKSAQADDAGFFVDETGIPWQEAGNGVSMARVAEPQAGFSAVVSQGDEGWSAELRISDSLLGGWNHQAGVMLVHSVPGLVGGPGAWPTGASGNSPSSWGPAVFGPPAPPSNSAPMASAGVARVLTVAPGEVLYLDGSGSYDPEGAPLTYSWTQIEGPAVTLVNPAHSTPAFVVGELDRETLHRFRLVVSDGSLESAPAETTLTLRPSMDAPETLFQQASINTGGGVTIQLFWPGEPGDLCVIQASTDLLEWEDLGFTTANHLGFLVYSDIQAGQFQQRYYRGQGVARPQMPAPRYALAFDGLNDSVDVPHHAALNAFPITISAWIRTSNSTELVRGIVSKYLDGSLNGYSLFLYGGHLRAWYFRNGANAVFGGGLGLDGGFVADGELHHVVFVVDAGGGMLYVDGEWRASRTWAGSSGAPSTSAMLRIGRYHAYPQTHEGLIDEVSIWNIALTPEQIRDLRGESLTGSEAGLRAFWPFDEGSGPLARDATGHGHDGLLQNGPVWTEFTKDRANWQDN
jgi:hypothetical protein